MKSASPRYRLTKKLINFIQLKGLGLSYCAIGIYICCTTSKQKDFTVQEYVDAATITTLHEVEFAIEELLEAGLVELVPAAVVQGGVA